MLGVFCSIDATHNDGLGRMCNDGQKMPNAVMKKIVTDEVSSTPSCYMIVCRPLLHGLMIIPIIVPFSIFLNPSGKSLGNISNEGYFFSE